MSQASIAAGADGLIIEIHPDPKKALSDGLQTLNFIQFESLIEKVKPIAKAMERELDLYKFEKAKKKVDVCVE